MKVEGGKLKDRKFGPRTVRRDGTQRSQREEREVTEAAADFGGAKISPGRCVSAPSRFVLCDLLLPPPCPL